MNATSPVEALLFAALEKSNEAERADFLDSACGGDAELRGQVEKLLRAHADVGDFLQKPVVEQLAGALAAGDATQALDPCTDQSEGAMTRSVGEGTSADDDGDLGFLQPSNRPDSLGRIGHYEVLQVLGRGAFGIVFRAFDDVLQRVVALKVMAPQIAATSPARKRFLREARSSAQVRHENVVQVYEVAEQPLPYLAMEFIPGETLQQKLDRVGPLDVPETLRIGRQIAEGLAAAHATDLIHRDIKPGNVLLEGGQHKVKITDFGLARAADDASISQSGIIAGTPMYMAPEQAEGKTLDQRADLFSLGSVLYQMVAGRPPFRANSTLSVLKRVAEDQPRAIREIIPETPQWLCDIIAKLHAKSPDDRFQSAREVADVLADCEAQLKANSRLNDFSRIPRSEPRRSGRWKRVVAAAAVLLPLIALTATELTGVTDLFHKQPGVVPSPNPALSPDDSESAGWAQIFNGKDLTGWWTEQPEKWKVSDGLLIGAGDRAYLRWQKTHRDFSCRIEAKVISPGAAAINFRGFEGATALVRLSSQKNEEAGALCLWSTLRKTESLVQWKNPPSLQDGWFSVEISATGKKATIKVNGITTAERTIAEMPDEGTLALVISEKAVVQFRKIEIKEPPAATEALPPTFKNRIGMEFVIVPKGKSWLGGGKDKLGEEVEIPADFYLGKYEVTQEEWEKVMGEKRSLFSRTGDDRDAVKDITDEDLKRFPVDNVSWNDCRIFVMKLNKLEQETGWVYRLPTETEWEYACRGGPMSDKAQSDFDFYFAEPTNKATQDQANFSYEATPKRPCKVGSYKPNRLGLHDMHGNVWEWCDGLYDPKDPAPGPRRSIRGGCWVDDLGGNGRAAVRQAAAPGARSHFFGLRVARVPSGAASPEVKTRPAIGPFTDADVQRIAALPAAEQVEEVRKELMRRNPGFDGKFEHKIEDGVVTEFRIVTDQVTDIAPIRVFNALRVVDLGGTHTNYHPNGQLADLSSLKGMNLTELTKLNLNLTKVGDVGLVHFKDCTNLTYLGLGATRVSDNGLAYFKNCKSLTSLELFYIPASDAGLAYFKDCKGLTRLNLVGTKVSDAGLANFKDCKNLTTLSLDRTQVGDAGMVHFQDCKSLTDLGLAETKVSDVGLVHFKDCKKLIYLSLTFTQVGDAGLARLKGMPLRVLWIYNTGITDLTPLQGMPLEKIYLTPKNITRGLDILRDMKSLKTIGIREQAWPAAEFWERYGKGEFK
jgi:serine/threonine protein kinase/formylglycine-generating enzyme required for sulfatase activity